jgi:hypothetical protein
VIGSFEALVVALVAVLPGAVYTTALANRGASWAWPKADVTSQVIRFLGTSAVFHAIFAPVTYWGYRQLIAAEGLRKGDTPLYWWPILLLYLLIPYLWGEWTVRSRKWDSDSSCLKRRFKSFVGLYTAATPEPRAWDWLFARPGLAGIVRMQLTTGEWKIGYWGDSFASSYGEDGDLYMGIQYLVDEEGEPVPDAAGAMQETGAGLLIRWSEIRYLEFIEETVQFEEEEGHDG